MDSSTSYVTPQATCQLTAWLTAVGIPNSFDRDHVNAVAHDQKKVAIQFAEKPEKPVVVRLSYSSEKHQTVTLYKQHKPQDLDLVGYMRKYAQENDLKVLDFSLDGDRSIVAKFMVPPSQITIDVNRFTAHSDSGYDINDAYQVFSELQTALGYQPKLPVNRGVEAENVRNNGSFGEDTIFRHREFRRSPNPTAADFARYESVIKTAIRIFTLRWPRLMTGYGIEIEDLRQYCLVWVTNFIGLYERADLKPEDNNSVCYRYLAQRFLELKNWMSKRAKNSMTSRPGGFSQREVFFNEEGEVFDGGTMNSDLMDTVMFPERYIGYPLVVVDAPEDTQYKARNALYTNHLDNKERRRAATVVLQKLLSGLTHEDYVEKLSGLAMNSCCDVEARLEAVHQLKKHSEQCKACSEYAEVLAVKVHEDISRADPFSS